MKLESAARLPVTGVAAAPPTERLPELPAPPSFCPMRPRFPAKFSAAFMALLALSIRLRPTH